MNRPRRLGIRLLVLTVGLLLARVSHAQSQNWCDNPIPPCNTDDPTSVCYQPHPPDPPCELDECNNCKKSPCYVGTGSYDIKTVDLTIRTTGFPLRVARRYDSTHAIDGPLGIGWTSGLISRLYHAVYLYAAPSTYQREAFIQMPDGSRYRFVDNGNGTFTPPQGRYDTLVHNGVGTWSLTLQRTRSVYQFDTAGALTSMTDDYGNQLTVTYDGNGRVQQIADASGSGRFLNLSWGPDGRISTVQDSSGRQIQYAYNAQGALASATNSLGQIASYSYFTGRFGPLLSQVKDHWNRVITDVTYDPTDRVTSYTEGGETYTYTYTYLGNPGVTAKTDSAGNRFVYPFASGGLVSDTTPPSGGGNPTHTDYYSDGSIQQFIDGAGVKTYLTYNSQGQPLTITIDYQGPNPVRFDYTYDTFFVQKVASITPRDPSTGQLNPDWQAWRYDYYPPGSLAPGALYHVYRVHDDGTSLDALASYQYDAHGRAVQETGPTGGVTDYTYDSFGNLTTVTSPANNDVGTRAVITYGYDSLGRRVSVADALGHVTSYTYDVLDRITSTTLPKPTPSFPLDFSAHTTYDNYDAPSGILFTHQADPNGNLTKRGTDQFGRLAKTFDALGGTTAFTYTRSLLTAITDTNGNATAYGYDAGKRLTTVTYPDGATERYTYTGDNLLYQRFDRRNQSITYTYDHQKRLTQKIYPNSTSITYIYQGQKITQIVDSSASPTETHTFGYDPSYRVVTETQGPRGTINYQYNADDTLMSYFVQGGPSTTYSYYPNGSLDTIVWSPTTGQFKYIYTLDGLTQRVTFPSGQYREYTYDDQGRITQLTGTHPTAGNLATYTYGYDVNPTTGVYDRLGQRVSATASVPSQGLSGHVTTLEYDAKNQLIRASYPNVAPFNGENHSWTYDGLGNRLTKTINGASQSYTYQKIGANPQNWLRLLSDGTDTYTNDANGSMITRNGPSGNFTFTWDAENRLASISAPSPASYGYDFRGRRQSRQEAASSSSYLYQGMNAIRDITNSSDYLFGPGVDEPLAISQGGQTYYTVTSAMGSVELLASASGSIQNTYLYDVWGQLRQQTGSLPNPFGYTGREFGVAGTIFYRARYYSPSIGRFTSDDPMRMTPPSERYAYARNSPQAFLDPSGLYPSPCPPDCTCSGWSPLRGGILDLGVYRIWNLSHAYPTEIPAGTGVGLPQGTITGSACTCQYEFGGLVHLWQPYGYATRQVTCHCYTYTDYDSYYGEPYETPEPYIAQHPPTQMTTTAPSIPGEPRGCACPGRLRLGLRG